jgi:hypothetical protein
MRALGYVLALALLLGVANASAAEGFQARLGAAQCRHVQAGATLVHARYGAEFKVDAVDKDHSRAFGRFPGTAQPDARVPVKCQDLVRL